MFNLVSAPRPASPVCTLVSPTWNRTPSIRGILKPLRRTSSSTSIPKASSTGKSSKKVQFNEEPSVRLYNPEDSPVGHTEEPAPKAVPESPKPSLPRRRTGIVRRAEWTSPLCCSYDGSRASSGSSAWSDDEDEDEDDVPVRPAFARRGTGPPPKVDWTAQVRPSADDTLVELPGKYPVMVSRKVFEEAAARSAAFGGLSPPVAAPSIKVDTGASKVGAVMPQSSRREASARTQTSGSPTTASTALMRSPSRKAEEDAIEDVVSSANFLRHHLQGPIELRLEYAIQDLDIDEMDAEGCEELAKAVEQELEEHSAAPPPRKDQVEDHIEFLTKLHEYIMDSCEA